MKLLKKITHNNNTILKFGSIPYRKGEIMKSNINNKQLLKLGWQPKTSLNDGLKKTIKYYCFNTSKL